jgi:signal transduction histidine kinase
LVNVDAVRLEQVVVNLVDNAIKYSPTGGQIEIRLKESGPDLVHLTVADQGIGVPECDRARIFDRFYQATSGRESRGMGLGLFISRQIVLLHGGELRAEFPPEGGTRMIVELPT